MNDRLQPAGGSWYHFRMTEQTRVAVIRAGITGLCAAHELVKRFGAGSVMVIDAADRPGGYAHTERAEGFLCDSGPNGYLPREPRLTQWVEELGLGDERVRANEAAAHRFILKDGRLVEIVGPPRFFVSPLLSVGGRARLLAEPLIRAKRNGEPESIWDFAARRIGPEAADTLVSAMVLGVFGGDAHRLSLEHCFPRMAAMEREHGGLFRAMLAMRGGAGGPMGSGGVLTTFRGGIGALAERAAERLGHSLRLGNKATAVERSGSAWRVCLQDGNEIESEFVVVATPAHVTAELMAGLDAELSRACATIAHAPIAVVCTAYRREDVSHDMNGFGFLAPPNQAQRLLGCIWTSSVFPQSAPEGWVFLRSMIGGDIHPEDAALPDAALLGHVAREVHPLLGITRTPEFVRIYRHRHGIPQYRLDHGDVLRALEAAEARHPGLAIAGNAYRGVSLNDCVASAHRAVQMIAPA